MEWKENHGSTVTIKCISTDHNGSYNTIISKKFFVLWNTFPIQCKDVLTRRQPIGHENGSTYKSPSIQYSAAACTWSQRMYFPNLNRKPYLTNKYSIRLSKCTYNHKVNLSHLLLKYYICNFIPLDSSTCFLLLAYSNQKGLCEQDERYWWSFIFIHLSQLDCVLEKYQLNLASSLISTSCKSQQKTK